MVDATSTEISDKAADMAADCLMDVRRRLGDLAANAIARGYIQAAAAHLINTLGVSGAFEALTQQADEILVLANTKDGRS